MYIFNDGTHGKCIILECERKQIISSMQIADFYYFSIHPRDKLDVARRLALAGRAVAYNESNVDYQGPLPTSFAVSNGTVTIKFGHSSDGKHIEVRDTARGFDVREFIYCF